MPQRSASAAEPETMRELLGDIRAWRDAGHEVALATVVKAWGSAPRPLGAKMAISSAGHMAGSVSGGCIEAAVAQEAREVLASGAPKLLAYGVSDDTAWSVGLSCGGAIEVFLEPLDLDEQLTRRLVDELDGARVVALATLLRGDGVGSRLLLVDSRVVHGTLGSRLLDRQVGRAATTLAEDRRSGRSELAVGGEARDVFIDLLLPPPEIVIVGAVHVAVHLVAFARRLGFRTIVIDPRTAFATPERFATADRLVAEWPAAALEELTVHASSAFVFLSHDPKIDLPGLEVALRSPAFYVGALGSRRTHAKRCAALAERGFSTEEIERLHAPIGLALGGRRAEEIALAIMAEIVAVEHASPLAARDGGVLAAPAGPHETA